MIEPQAGGTSSDPDHEQANMTPDLINATLGITYLALWTFIGGVMIRHQAS